MRKVLVIFFVVAVLSFVAGAADRLDVYFIDVGQGDAILIDYGDWECLIDAGVKKEWAADDPDWDLLVGVIDGPLDVFVLSHPHSDHYSAFDLLACEYRVELLLYPATDDATERIAKMLKELEDCDPKLYETIPAVRGLVADASTPIEGMELDWRVLHPTTSFAADEDDKNENSLVMSLTFGSVMFVFAGDVQTRGAAELATVEFAAEHMILKVPHHGAEAGLVLLGLPGFDPEISIVSVGELHSYGHPDRNLMDALAATSDVYVTTCGNLNGCLRDGSLALEDYPSVFVDVGTVLVSTDGDSVWVTTSSLGRPTGQCNGD